MTVFFTHCWKCPRLSLLALAVGRSGLLLVRQAAHAQTSASEVTQMRLERTAEGLLLYATVRLDLPAAVEEALVKGVPMIFLAEVEVVRHRWYWSDEVVASVQRHMRLAYQPLTRRWRLNVASGVITPSSLGMALNQNFDSLARGDGLGAAACLAGGLPMPSVLDPDSTHKVEFRFGLDLAQLPRPFQIGAFGQSDWTISASAPASRSAPKAASGPHPTPASSAPGARGTSCAMPVARPALDAWAWAWRR